MKRELWVLKTIWYNLFGYPTVETSLERVRNSFKKVELSLRLYQQAKEKARKGRETMSQQKKLNGRIVAILCTYLLIAALFLLIEAFGNAYSSTIGIYGIIGLAMGAIPIIFVIGLALFGKLIPPSLKKAKKSEEIQK